MHTLGIWFTHRPNLCRVSKVSNIEIIAVVIFRGSALERRRKEREKEMDSDNRDRRREREEVEDIKRKLLEEGHDNVEEEIEKVRITMRKGKLE